MALTWVAIWFFFVSGTPVVFVQVKSNYVEFDVQRAQLSVFAFRDVIVVEPENPCDGFELARGGSLTALVSPPTESTVTYVSHPEFVQITVRPTDGGAGILVDRAGSTCEINEPFVLLIRNADMIRNQPLPLLGNVQIGREIGVPTRPEADDLTARLTDELTVERIPGPLLLEGKAEVFGRSARPLGGRQLYPVPNGVFPIPRGSRLVFRSEEAAGSVIRRDGQGFMDIEFHGGSVGYRRLPARGATAI